MSKELFEYQKELDMLTSQKLPLLDRELIDARQVSFFLERQKKIMRADCMRDFYNKDPRMPFSKAEMLAFSSPKYREFETSYAEAYGKWFDAHIRRETIINRIDALRTFISLEKQKLGML